MNYEPKPGCWTVVAWNEWDEKPAIIKKAKNKLQAWMEFDSLKRRFDEVAVFDENAEYCDPCEL